MVSSDEYFDCQSDSSTSKSSEIKSDDGYTLKFNQMLESEECNHMIHSTFVINTIAFFFSLLKFTIKYVIPYSALETLCYLFNVITNMPILPNLKYKLDKLLINYKNIEYHAFCPHSKLYLRKFEKKEKKIHCVKCDRLISVDGNNVNFFVLLNPASNI